VVADMSSLVNPSCREHVMLLYDNDYERNEVAVNYINEALKNSQLVVYASVDADDASYMTKVSSKIMNYKENMEHGDLLVLSLKPFYKRALTGDLEAFKDFKELLEEIVQERTLAGRKNEVLIVADCADNLSREKLFDEDLFVERWWQNTHLEWLEKDLKITIICPHPSEVLEDKLFANHKQKISSQHSMTLR
jgi:hypothetical protein